MARDEREERKNESSRLSSKAESGLTATQRREMWNQFADQVAFAAGLVIGDHKISDSETLEEIHSNLLAISLMMRRGGRGKPRTRKAKIYQATERVAESTLVRKKEWLEKHGRRNMPASELERIVGEECDREQTSSGIRPIPRAVKGIIRRGKCERPNPDRPTGWHLQRAQRAVENSWYQLEKAHKKARGNSTI